MPSPGAFATIYREWKSGDSIEIELPGKTRLEAIDARYPDTVALLYGPPVLLAITNTPPRVTRPQLLEDRFENMKWQVETADARITILPFTVIADEQYFTYLHTSGA
jgi:uncharacterized protein